jgi:predicted Zn finger-like uncharacterized protein
MDVTCDRCKAEYEFDEALLGERGTTVKCSACGHVFRVLPPSRASGRAHLRLRFARDGRVGALSSLRELQQRIRAGEVGLDDELGREGFPFRPLRDVPELKNFFLSQPGRQARSTVRPEGTYPRPEASTKHMPVHPESISPGPLDAAPASLPPDQPVPESVPQPEPQPEPPQLDPHPPEPPHQPDPTRVARPAVASHPDRDAAEARRREASARAEQAVAEQRAANRSTSPSAPPEKRERDFRKGTIAGVGPDGQLPPASRMPGHGPRSQQEPAATAPSQGPANPHASKLPPPGTGTMTGLPSNLARQTLYGRPSPLSEPAAVDGIRPGSTHPLANRGASEPPPADEPAHGPKLGSATQRGPVPPIDEQRLPQPQPLLEPDRFPQFKSVPAQLPPGAMPQRKLYLDDDEKPPPRANEGSRGWLYVALILLAVAGGSWFGMTRMRVSGKAVLEPATEAEQPIATQRTDPDEAEPGPGDQPAAQAGPTGAAPFAPPLPEVQEELARRSEAKPMKPVQPTPAPATPATMAPPTAKVASESKPAKPPAARPAPTQTKAPTATPSPAPARASAGPVPASAAGGKNDRLARADRAIAANPQDYGAQLDRADALFDKGDNTAALEAYKQALALRPTGSEANSGMGFALLKDGKTSASLPYFDRAASSGYAEANIGLGDAYRVLGQHSSAKEAYQAYLDRLPTGARAEYARTWLDKLSGGRAPERKADPEPYRPAGELTPPPQ